jgi:hypothetical protein
VLGPPFVNTGGRLPAGEYLVDYAFQGMTPNELVGNPLCSMLSDPYGGNAVPGYCWRLTAGVDTHKNWVWQHAMSGNYLNLNEDPHKLHDAFNSPTNLDSQLVVAAYGPRQDR